MAESAIAINRHAFGADHQRVLTFHTGYAALLAKLGHDDQAESMLRDAVAASHAKHGENHPEQLGALDRLVEFLFERGRYDELEPLCERLIAVCEHSFGETSPRAIDQRLQCAAYSPPEERLARVTFELETLASDYPDVPLAQHVRRIVRSLADMGDTANAEALARQAVPLLESSPAATRRDVLMLTGQLFHLQLQAGRADEADGASAAVLKEVLADYGSDVELVGKFSGLRGRCLMAMGRDAEAEPLLAAGCDREMSMTRRPQRPACEALLRLYERTDRQSKAERLQAEIEMRQSGRPAIER